MMNFNFLTNIILTAASATTTSADIASAAEPGTVSGALRGMAIGIPGVFFVLFIFYFVLKIVMTQNKG